MQFLADVYVECETCNGLRYNREALEVRYRGYNVADVLAMSVDLAAEVFGSIPNIARRLESLQRVGLGYLTLGQQATTLSGGEAQRVKLATELAKRSTGKTLYILDEPTTGLHFDDVRRLVDVLQKLVDAGNTVVVIEHNLDVIKSTDWIIDLGPDGGEGGGRIVAEGQPEHIATTDTHTGKFLSAVLQPRGGVAYRLGLHSECSSASGGGSGARGWATAGLSVDMPVCESPAGGRRSAAGSSSASAWPCLASSANSMC